MKRPNSCLTRPSCETLAKGDYKTVMVDLVRPVSGPGEVTPNTADPLKQANISLNYFNNDIDVIAMREGIRYAYDVAKYDEAFKDVVLAQYPFSMPLDNDELMHRTILDRSQTPFHPCGTARISKDIRQGVVGPELRVYGVKKLCVIDALCIPVISDCRVQHLAYAVTEEGADAIKRLPKDFYPQRTEQCICESFVLSICCARLVSLLDGDGSDYSTSISGGATQSSHSAWPVSWAILHPMILSSASRLSILERHSRATCGLHSIRLEDPEEG